MADDDGDGYCEHPVTCVAGALPGDCDDGDDEISPAAADICNGIDDDCDPSTGEDDDRDGDGLGPCSGDCDDDDPGVSPAVIELCDGVDENCNGVADDACVSCDAVVAPGDDLAAAVSGGGLVCLEVGVHTTGTLTLGGADLELLGLAGRSGTHLTSSGRVLDVGSGAAVTITGLTLTGSSTQGAALRINYAGGQVLLQRSTLSVNNGNAMWVYGSDDVLLQDVLVIDNSSVNTVDATGVRIADSTVWMERVTLARNSPYGAIHGELAGITMDHCRVEDNADTRLSNAAGIHSAGASWTVRQTVFDGNSGVEATAISLNSAGDGTPSTLDASYLVVRNHTASRVAGIDTRDGAVANISYLRSSNNLSLRADSRPHGDLTVRDGADLFVDHVTIAGGTGDGALRQFLSGSYAAAHSLLIADRDGPPLRADTGASAPNLSDLVLWNNSGYTEGFLDPLVSGQAVALDPMFVDWQPGNQHPDLHLGAASAVASRAVGGETNPDGGPAGIGAYGGPGADGWDLDGDGYFEWWQPGPYQPGYAAAGWDCDDEDPDVHPGEGCP